MSAPIAMSALLFCSLGAGCSRDLHHAPTAGLIPAAADLCTTNLANICYELKVWGLSDPVAPANLNLLGKELITNATMFVCPASGHKPGSLTNIEHWSDYIYFDLGEIFDGAPPEVPLLICPPENHHGQFANVIWVTGNTDRLSTEQTKRLIKEPWYLIQSGYAHLDRLKEQIHVRVPKRWKKAYPDPYAPDSPAQAGGRPK